MAEIKTNKDKLVMQSAMGSIHHPTMKSATKIAHDGSVWAVPAVGGICYNVKVGDSVFGLAGDHIEPGVSVRNNDAVENLAFNFLSCIGNKAVVMSGDAKGACGVITGTHGGIEHVLAHFAKDDLNKMAPGDKILVKAYGQGLAIEGCPDIKVMNIDPRLLENLGVKSDGGCIEMGVAAVVPAHLMGSGIGSANAYTGDYDIMTMDKGEIEKNNLDGLRFGDIVALKDCDTTNGRCFRKGAITVGVVVHSDCVLSGHGPGVATIMSCQTDKISCHIDKDANIANIIDTDEYRAKIAD